MKYSSSRFKHCLKRLRMANKEINSRSESFPKISLSGLFPPPQELLLSISEFLSVVDLICLFLCNRQLQELFLRELNRQSPLTKHDKLLVLNRLERDSPKYFAMLTHASSTYLRNRLSFLQLKLAMKRFYYGPSAGISTDSLSYTQVRQISPDMILLFSSEAQIYPKLPDLHVRMQEILLFRARDELNPALHNLSMSSNCPVPCLHYGPGAVIYTVVTLLKRQKALWTRNCRDCNTDAEIEIVEFDSKIALIVTRWINLGPGLTKEDPLWKAHLYTPGSGLKHPDTAWSPRSCFEKMAPHSHKDLQGRNLSYLMDQQYKNGKPFIALGPKFCYISYKEPIKERGINVIWSQIQRHRVMARRKKAAEKRTRRKSPVNHSSSSKGPPRVHSDDDTFFPG